LMVESGPRRGPVALVRVLSRAVNSAVARFPWSWRLFSGPARRFFDSVAVGWDEHVTVRPTPPRPPKLPQPAGRGSPGQKIL
jgi:hypothetical protein